MFRLSVAVVVVLCCSANFADFEGSEYEDDTSSIIDDVSMIILTNGIRCETDEDCFYGFCSIKNLCQQDEDIEHCIEDIDCPNITQHCYHTDRFGNVCLTDSELPMTVIDECQKNEDCSNVDDNSYCSIEKTGNLCISQPKVVLPGNTMTNTDTSSDTDTTGCVHSTDCDNGFCYNGNCETVDSYDSCDLDSDCDEGLHCFVSSLGSICVLTKT
eukprot:UN32963